jgi:hypothetical protein
MLALPPSTSSLREEKRFKEIVRRYEGKKFFGHKDDDGDNIYYFDTLTVKEFAISNIGVLTVFIHEKVTNKEACFELSRHLHYFGYDKFIVRTANNLLFEMNRGVAYRMIGISPSITIATDLVAVQPLGMPQGNIFYLDYHHQLGIAQHNIGRASGIEPVYQNRYERRMNHFINEMKLVIRETIGTTTRNYLQEWMDKWVEVKKD